MAWREVLSKGKRVERTYLIPSRAALTDALEVEHVFCIEMYKGRGPPAATLFIWLRNTTTRGGVVPIHGCRVQLYEFLDTFILTLLKRPTLQARYVSYEWIIGRAYLGTGKVLHFRCGLPEFHKNAEDLYSLSLFLLSILRANDIRGVSV